MSTEATDQLVFLPLYDTVSDSSDGQWRMPFPIGLAQGADRVYRVPGPLPGNWQYILVNYDQVARMDDLVLFYHLPREKYLVVPLVELPYYLKTVDPHFDQRRRADLEDMHLGVVVAVCERM